jgi:hypothetical protein
MALTVAQLADVIRRPDADRAGVVERLRAWTDAGLLEPAGDRNPGTGKPRTYPDQVMYDAAILNSLADAGFPIGKARYFMGVMGVAQQAKDAWTMKRRADLYLEIAAFHEPNHQGGRHAVFFHEGKKHGHLGKFIHPRAEGSYFLAVGKLFLRIEECMKKLAKAAQLTEVKQGETGKASVRE